MIRACHINDTYYYVCAQKYHVIYHVIYWILKLFHDQAVNQYILVYINIAGKFVILYQSIPGVIM